MRYADAEKISAALEALESIYDLAGRRSYSGDNPGGYGRLAQAAQTARDQLVDVLIVANVWTKDEVAGGVLHAD